ncbi:hypothetical protein FRB90_011278 [Tulasnella sp. 427]|nr:hypothetical protein FRB90_011278 [Tulasnella sp. 427]
MRIKTAVGMSSSNKYSKLADMPPLKAEEREARLPLYLQRLLAGLLDQPIPDEQDLAYYQLCILCDSASTQNEIWLTEQSLSSEKFNLLKELQSQGNEFTSECQFDENPYGKIPEYVNAALLPPVPWRSALKTAAPAARDGSTFGTGLTLSSPTKKTFATQPTPTIASTRLPGGTTTRIPDNVRRLRNIHCLDMAKFEAKVASYVSSLPMGFQTRSGKLVRRNEKMQRLSIPAHGFNTNVELSNLNPPQDEMDIQVWVSSLAATTAETLLHLSDPNTADYHFSGVVGKDTKGQKSDLSWKADADDEAETYTKPLRRLVIEVKTPWTLDPLTVGEFVKQPHLPTLNELEEQKRAEQSDSNELRCPLGKVYFSKVQNIWAQIYDYCVTQGNYFFVLTSYEFWVFGVFSADYSSAQVTNPIPYDARDPTILGCLMYWTQSAMLTPGLHRIPWGELRLTDQWVLVVVLAHNVRLYQTRMNMLPGKKTIEDPWKTAKRLMKSLGVALNEGEKAFSEIWARGDLTSLIKQEQQDQSPSRNGGDSSSTVITDFMLRDLVSLASPSDEEVDHEGVVHIKQEDVDEEPFFHGCFNNSHSSTIPPLGQTQPKLVPNSGERRRRPSQRRKVSSHHTFVDQTFNAGNQSSPSPHSTDIPPFASGSTTAPRVEHATYGRKSSKNGSVISSPLCHDPLQGVSSSRNPVPLVFERAPRSNLNLPFTVPSIQLQPPANLDKRLVNDNMIDPSLVGFCDTQDPGTAVPTSFVVLPDNAPAEPSLAFERQLTTSPEAVINDGLEGPPDVPYDFDASAGGPQTNQSPSAWDWDPLSFPDVTPTDLSEIHAILLENGIAFPQEAVELRVGQGGNVVTGTHPATNYQQELSPWPGNLIHTPQNQIPSLSSTPNSVFDDPVTPYQSSSAHLPPVGLPIPQNADQLAEAMNPYPYSWDPNVPPSGRWGLALDEYAQEDFASSKPSKPKLKRSNSEVGFEGIVTGTAWTVNKRPRQ